MATNFAIMITLSIVLSLLGFARLHQPRRASITAR